MKLKGSVAYFEAPCMSFLKLYMNGMPDLLAKMENNLFAKVELLQN